ncbi:MAG: translocation/assembly module TamB domain-containing protein, partial [Sediminibacterium sp.]
HLNIEATELQVIQGKFNIESGFESPVPYFDGAHIKIHDLNAKMYNVQLQEDTIRAKVNLSLKERSGFEIKKLNTQFKLTPSIMEFADLSLKTNNSFIGPYYAMQFNSFKKDFNNYMQKVTMKAHLENSLISIDDIAYFTPTLKNIHQKIKLSFHFKGTVNNFETNDLLAFYNNSNIKGSFSMKGLPDLRNTQIDFNNVTSSTNYKDLSNWLPALKNIKDLQFEKLGKVLFAGNFKGTVYDFITKGAFNTDLGNVNTEIRLQFPIDKEPSYEGMLKTTHFNAGKLLDIQSLGLINFNGKIKGSSFNLNKQKTNIQGNIDSILWNNYNYSNITTNGDIQKGAYNGTLRIKDPNINFISNIEVDFNHVKPKINAVGDLQNTNLKELGFSNNKIQLTGLLDINFDGDSIDNFMGYAKFYNGQLKGEKSIVRFDSITLQSSVEKGIKYLRLASDDISADISGKFNISHLPASIQYFMQRYLPSYIPAPKNTPANQLFDIQIKTNYIEPFIRIFNSSFSGFNNLNLKGSINTDKKILRFNATVPFAQWEDMALKGGQFNGNGNKDSLFLLVKSDNYQLTDSFKLVDPVIHIQTVNDKSNIQITATSNNALQNINLSGIVNTYSDGLAIKWKPSYFLLNQKRWDINNGGEISLRKNNTFAKGVKLSQGFQELLLTSAKDNNLQLELNDIILGDITKLFFRYPQLEGNTNGTIYLKNVLDNFELNADLKIDQFSFNNEVVGNTTLTASFNKNTGLVPFAFDIPNSTYNLSAEGSYNIKDSINPLDATLYLNHSKFSLVEQFIGGVITNLEGKADGNIHFGGRIENPVLLGAAKIQDASLKVDYTKVQYFIKDATIQFTNEGIDFGNIQLTDQLNRKANFKGKIYNEGFKHLTYDLEMSSPKIELLHMGSADNPYFYGNAVGKAAMTIKGPEENIKMVITADVNDSSHLYIPNTTSKSGSSNDFILFKKYGKTAVKSADLPTYNLLVDLDLSANNKTKIDVILDELTGDIIKAKGNGRLKIKAGNIEPLNIRGKYNIESGNYDFNFQSFIKKPFELIPDNGNYIEWTGNPYDAEMHVDARYTADRISLNELVGSANFSNAVKSYRGSVYVIASLRNKLFQPSIKFSIGFPQGNPISSDNEFSQFISRLERDENEILKQVSFLIVFNSFAPVGFSTGNSNNAYSMTSIGINTISQLLTKEVNKSVTHLLNKVTGDNSLRFDVGSSVYNSGNLLDPTGSGIAINANKIDRQRVNLKLGRSFLNDKVIINVGGDLDFNVRSTTNIQNDNLQWLPDVNIEFILTKDRKLRAIIFNRNSLDINGSSLGRRNRQGVSISYRKDFDSAKYSH